MDAKPLQWLDRVFQREAMRISTPLLQSRWFTASLIVLMLSLLSKWAIHVPGLPAPFTLQTLTVGYLGIYLGPRAAAQAVALWVILGLGGAPVFADPFWSSALTPTTRVGYILAMPLAAALAGWGRDLGWPLWSSLLLGSLAVLTLGSLCLSIWLGWEGGWRVGFMPYVAAEALKAFLGGALLDFLQSEPHREAE